MESIEHGWCSHGVHVASIELLTSVSEVGLNRTECGCGACASVHLACIAQVVENALCCIASAILLFCMIRFHRLLEPQHPNTLLS